MLVNQSNQIFREMREWSNRPPWKGVRCIAAQGFKSLSLCQKLLRFGVMVAHVESDPDLGYNTALRSIPLSRTRSWFKSTGRSQIMESGQDGNAADC